MQMDASDPIEWINANLPLKETDSAGSLYDHMDSQSGESLPVIYQPFDGRQRPHFTDRGSILDYAVAARGGRVLDFGPGDGWPSLLLAPVVSEVVGVDGSRLRVEVCARNARRLGLANTRFVHVPPGESLPFDSDSFDAVAAAASIEQSPDPKATLKELHRVLRPGGRLRMHYESLGCYRNGREREVEFGDRTLIFDRRVDEEYVRHYLLSFDSSAAAFQDASARLGRRPAWPELTAALLAQLREALVEAVTWTTQHPSCRTLLDWMSHLGFSAATPTYDGRGFAGSLFDRLPESERPSEMDGVNAMLQPLVEVVVTMEAPRSQEPWITAVK